MSTLEILLSGSWHIEHVVGQIILMRRILNLKQSVEPLIGRGGEFFLNHPFQTFEGGGAIGLEPWNSACARSRPLVLPAAYWARDCGGISPLDPIGSSRNHQTSVRA